MIMETLSFSTTLILLFVVYKLLDYLLRLPTIGRYSDRYILVTGCDSGFGQAIAQRLDGLGCHVFAGCLTETGQQELAKRCSQRLLALNLDITKHDSVLQALDFVKAGLPPGKGLWAVINNAGCTAGSCPDEWRAIDDYKKILDVNLFGTIDVAMTFLPLIKRSRGRVVNVSSLAGRITLPMGTAYSISKYGVEAFTDNLRRSLKLYGCKAVIIEPEFFLTILTNSENARKLITRQWNSTTSEIRDEFGEDCLQAYLKRVERRDKSCRLDITPVIDAYQHAVLGRFPRARYLIVSAKTRFLLTLSYLPEWLFDSILELVGFAWPVPQALKKTN